MQIGRWSWIEGRSRKVEHDPALGVKSMSVALMGENGSYRVSHRSVVSSGP